MHSTIIQLKNKIAGSMWFIPSLMSLGAMILSYVTLTLDERHAGDLAMEGIFLFRGTADGARAVLQAIAGSMITVAGTVFSITIVALTLAANQFGPGLLSNFLRDRVNQFVLGAFVSTFIYCMLVLRTVRVTDDFKFVPAISTSIAILFAILSFAVLIYFIHHIATSLNARHLVSSVHRNLDRSLEDYFPHPRGRAKVPRGEIPEDFDEESGLVLAEETGYVDEIDSAALAKIAADHDLIVRVERRPGHFVTPGAEMLRVYPKVRLSKKLASELQSNVYLNIERTRTQDIEFAVDQLVEVALRALSPSINDPFTAITCLDWLGASLCKLAGRDLSERRIVDPVGRLRVLVRTSTYEGVADAAFLQIRQQARGQAAVTIRLLETLERIARCVEEDDQREALRKHAVLTHRSGIESLAAQEDRDAVEERFRRVMKALAE
jgi:uncharacterized membrane protein